MLASTTWAYRKTSSQTIGKNISISKLASEMDESAKAASRRTVLPFPFAWWSRRNHKRTSTTLASAATACVNASTITSLAEISERCSQLAFAKYPPHSAMGRWIATLSWSQRHCDLNAGKWDVTDNYVTGGKWSTAEGNSFECRHGFSWPRTSRPSTKNSSPVKAEKQ